jgi:hypothetical protein
MNKVGRRSFGRTAILSAGAIVGAPAVDSLRFFFSPPRSRTIEEIAADVFTRHGASGLFVANAAGPWLILLRVLGAAASVATIMDWLNIRPSWAQRPDYSNAGGCTGNCQAQESEMRNRGISSFTAVHRAPANHNYALMAGHHARSARYNEAAIQYEGAPAINLRGRETEAIRAATEGLGRYSRLSNRDLAQAVGVTSKRDLTWTNPRTGERSTARLFDTASGGYILDNPRHPTYSGGMVAVHAPGLTDYDSPAVVGLENG